MPFNCARARVCVCRIGVACFGTVWSMGGERMPKTSRVDMVTLQKFPHPEWGPGFINVLEEIPNYRHLGNVLLKSPKGERVREIQSQNRRSTSKQAVLYDILQTWVTEDEQATWEKFVKHLYAAGFSNLAQAIESRLRDF